MTSQSIGELVLSPLSGPAPETSPFLQKRSWANFFASALIFLLGLHASPILAAVISVTPDRNPVRMDESFALIFSADKKPDDDPDFRPLEKDFDILSQSQNSQISVINGHYSKKTEWTLTVTAKRAGTLTIPTIAFGDDHSEPVAVVVEDAAPTAGGEADSELFLEVDAEPKNPYVQAQVIYSIRMWVRKGVGFAGGELNDPSASDALVERLGDSKDRPFSAERRGQQYMVIERRYAIFPQKSGTLRIEPLILEAQIADGGRSRFNSFFNQTTRLVRAHSDAVELRVRPVPTAFAGKHWLPAESLELEDSWSREPPKTTAGEPVTRTLSLRARGATVGLLSELSGNLQSVGNGDIKQYPDQPVMNEEKLAAGIASIRQEKTALMPSKPGIYKLPPVEIPWWNTRTDRLEMARLPERILTVQPSVEQAAQPAAPRPSLPQIQATGPEPSTPVHQSEIQVPAPAGSNLWFWLALLCVGGWLGTAAAWWLSRRQRNAVSEPEPVQGGDERAVRKALQQACRENDPHKARQALLNWAKTRWPDAAPTNLSELGGFAGGLLAAEIERLNRSLFGRGEQTWRGEALWAALEAMGSETDRKKKAPAFNLEPMYKL